MLVLVVVGELLPWLDVAQGEDADADLRRVGGWGGGLGGCEGVGG